MHLLACDGTLALVGTDIADPLPEWAEGFGSARFSPDGRWLAYTLTGGKVPGKAVVYNLAAKTSEVVLETPCASYTIGLVCGVAGSVVWIDPTTFLVEHRGRDRDFPGQMPCGANSDCKVPPDTYSIVTATGQIVASVHSVGAGSPALARGNTMVMDSRGEWLDLNEVRAGVGSAKELPREALPYSLSADGSRVAVVGNPWQLVDIRTSAAQDLGFHEGMVRSAWSEGRDLPCAWSPDEQFLACQFYDDEDDDGSVDNYEITVVPISASARGGVVATFAIESGAKLVGWAP